MTAGPLLGAPLSQPGEGVPRTVAAAAPGSLLVLGINAVDAAAAPNNEKLLPALSSVGTGASVTVLNFGPNALVVNASGTDQINQAAPAPVAVPVGESRTFVAAGATVPPLVVQANTWFVLGA